MPLLDHPIYLRADAALVAALDTEVIVREQRGRRLSRADLIRLLLWEALDPVVAERRGKRARKAA